MIAIVGMYDGLACASQGPARRPGLARIDHHRAGHDDDQVMVLTFAADPASGIWLASAAIRYRMLAAALVSSAERGRSCLARPTVRTFHRGLATV
ncbi:MAG TPA: hypothetical protein VJ370_17270, partial [Streptosporangiaceae bacterium]|nr:hypothetical protein [Streptosporangiaceae bacterium]